MDLWSVYSYELDNAHDRARSYELDNTMTISGSYDKILQQIFHFLALTLQHSVQKSNFLHSDKLTSIRTYTGPEVLLSELLVGTCSTCDYASLFWTNILH